MKTTTTVASVLLAITSNAVAQEVIGPVQWDYAYVDLNQACQRYYSLYPPSVKCIEDKLYRVQFKITYNYRGSIRTVFLTYIPGPQTRLDDNGNIIPPDYTMKSSS
jgi:hypothetical protein